jgi:uncharacterized OsmC-like protein
MAKRHLIAVLVDDELLERVKAAAKEKRCPVSQYGRNVLDDATAKKEDRPNVAA